MSRLHQAWESVPLSGDLQIITADQIRDLTGREPRLMMKFDHTAGLPPALAGRFILPLKNGVYALIKGRGYHQPEPCGPVLDYPRQTRFELKTTSTGISEMQHLDIAFNTGLLAHFLGEKLLYPTIRGRKRSPRFSFRVGSHELEVEGVQVEVDGGFEGRSSVTLVEAKIGECDDFHLRQLYYPVRFWSTHTQKRIRSVFFTYEPESGVYRFREYVFQPPDVYGPPSLVKAAAYRIVDAPASHFEPIVGKKDCPFPQADRLDKIAIIPFLVAEGISGCDELADVFEFSSRQGRYYQDACRALNLIDDEAELTPAGRDYLECSPEVRYRMLCRAVLKLPVMQEILSNLLLAPGRRLTRAQVDVVVQKATSLSEVTARRRSQTVWAWLTWVCRYCPSLKIDRAALEITAEVETSEGGVTEQLKLF